MKEMRDDRVHARMALVRDLFGLGVQGDDLADSRDRRGGQAESPDQSDELAEVRELPSRTGAGGIRNG
jgi:hypothetical protein